ncbi:MAG TPA: ABC transporter permease [Lacipirellulaceae bacterium]|jgi:ABC-type multidrug transport system permease subunit
MPSPDHHRRYWPLGQLISARVREFLREPEALFWVYGFPILMTVALGIAFRNQRVEKIVVDVVDGPAAATTRDALAGATTSERFQAEILPEEQARLGLRTGRTDLVVVAAADDGAISRQRYEYRFDPTRPQSVLARNAVDDQLQRAGGRQDVADVTLTPVNEPGSRYIDFLVPGLLGMSLMGGGLWGVGFVTVDMRMRKLLKRFLATPMKKIDFLMGIMLSRMLFMVPEVVVLLLFARYAFGVVNHGSVSAVMTLVLLGATMFSGIGLLVASRAKTIETVTGLMNLVMLPMWILSGIFFSSERFPAAAQPLIKAAPLTPLIDALRAVMLEGATLASQLPRVAIMAAWGIFSFALALRWFRWR